MPRKALPDAKKCQIESAFHAYWQQCAVEDYQEQLARRELGLDGQGARTIAKKWMEKCRADTHKVIKLSYQTIIDHAKGRTTRGIANQQKSWTTPEEVDLIIAYTAEVGARGWPLSHRRLKEHVDLILRARLGPDFPGVGKRWTYRFVLRHSDRLATELAAAREAIRGGAVNPTTMAAWFNDVLKPQLEGVDIENIYGSDEHSSNGMEGQREHVIVGRGRKNRAHQQAGGSRENITVIATICADGGALPPTVVMKGKGYQVSWGKQDNPLGASIGHSLRGWTTGEIGAAWIKEFDRLTKEKAAGRPRLLLLDGHNSHYTRAFLEHARKHNIRAICYPAHTTHVLQGLDVVVFGPLKRALREERIAWERTREKMNKNNFLAIYAKAHIRTMTSDNILSAFRKTGVSPFNPDVISRELLAPSRETSSLPTLPLPPATPVRIIAKLVGDLVVMEDLPDADDEEHESNWEDVPTDPFNPFAPSAPTVHEDSGRELDLDLPAAPSTPPPRQVRFVADSDPGDASSAQSVIADAVKRLGEAKLQRLVNSFTSSEVEFRAPLQIPTAGARQSAPCASAALNIHPETEREAAMFSVMQELEDQNEYYRRLLIEAQAVNILNQIYNTQLKEKLANRDQKAKQGKTKGRLMGHGLPVVLTSDEFYQRVVEYEEDQERKAAEQAARKSNLEDYRRAVEERKVIRAAQLEEHGKKREKWHADLARWEAEKSQWQADKRAGKVKGRSFGKEKPKCPKAPRAPPMPKVVKVVRDDPESDGEVFEQVEDGETTSDEE